MKKSFLILLSAVILLFTACDSWMQDDDFYADIENDVKVANAQQISVFVRYALTRQGKTDPDGPATFKVEIPHQISAITEPAYGFVRWAAFSTDFLSTGDNQTKNKDVYYIDEEDYRVRLAPKEIKAPAVVFEDATKAETKVKINVNRNDIFIVPIVTQRPAVALSIPAIGASDVVRNMSVRISFTKPMNPDSFKNEAGEYDKITITQGRQSLSADGDIEIISQDITDRFEAPVFSRNLKMITLKFKESEKDEGFAAQSSVSVIISKDVKDSTGFSMTDDDKVTFSIGSAMDTLAPRIIRLTAGNTLSNFDSFKGMYKNKDTWNLISGVTQMAPWSQGSGTSATYFGADDAPDTLDGQVNSTGFYDKFAPLPNSSEPGYRVGKKIYIHTIAEDIAGSGIINNPTALENDVAMIGVKATLLFNSNGDYVSETEQPLAADGTPAGAPIAVNYLAQNVGPGISQTFINLVHARNVANNTTSPSDDGYIPEDKGFLFEYDLSKMPDGLIRLDVYATDTVQNSGYTEAAQYSRIYGNGYASLFVVKDTTPPNAATNASNVTFDLTHKTDANYFNNVVANSHNRSQIQINADTSSIVDAGHERLRSKHNNIKWVAKLTSDTSWNNSVPASTWTEVTNALGGASAPSYFAEPAAQGQIPFTYALMDDLGNISEVASLTPSTTIYYDSVAPVVSTLSFSAENGETAGMAASNVLTNQTLSIPITEETSGLKMISFKITKDGSATDYEHAVEDSPINLTVNGTTYTNGSGATGFSKSGKTITFNSPISMPAGSVVTVKGLKIYDSVAEGEYTINAAVTDAADNITTTTSQRVLINIDHTAPVISEIKIPSVKKSVRYGNSDNAEYWVDYSSLSNTGGTPRTYVDILFTETNTGAKVFDFASSSMKLTDDSNIFVINSGYNIVSEALTVTRNTTSNKITIDSSQAVKTNGTTIAGVRITNVELAAEGYNSNITLKVSDAATNESNQNATLKSSDSGTILAFTNFKFDSGTPVTGTPSYEDRGIEDANHIEAMSGYTSEQYIKATVVFTPTSSGIYELQLDGDAIFDSTTSVTNNAASPVSYPFDIIGADAKTIRFKKTVSGSEVTAVLGTSTSAITIIINNLKLTSGDGTKSVAIKAKSFGGVQNTGTSSEIYLDETDPVWVGLGLYTQSFYADEPEELTYPHPISNGKAYGIAGSEVGGTRDLYFYSSVGSDDHLSKFYRIAADFTEDHHRINSSNEDVTVRFEEDNGTLVRENLVLVSRTEFGNMKARVRDMAGNQSDYKTFAVVKDEEFAVTNPNPNASNPADAEYKAIDNYMTLQMPDSAASVFASQGAGDLSYAANTFSYYPSTPGYNLRAHGYVIKQGANPYKIIVKLGSQGTASTDKQVDGVTAVPVAGIGADKKYNRTKITTSSAPLEYYSVSHWYDYYRAPEYDSNSFIPITPDYAAAANSLYWHPYSESSTDGVTHPDVDIVSRVDEYGNIEIEIPRITGCPPLTLILKDACGNITYRLIRPISFNTADANSNRTNNAAVAWIVDNEVGQSTYRGLTSFTLDTAVVKGYSDANFYNGTVTLNSGYAWSETCRYTTSGVLGGDEGSESAYSLKSRIITWTDSTYPTQTAFENATTGPNASAWYYRKQSNSITGDTSFGLVNDFPQNAASSTYKLFYIVQDTVGNYDIYQITRTSASDITLTKVFTSTAELNNVTVSGVQNWLYDATGPVITTPIPETAFHKINTVGGVNYYSGNSVINFTITDGGSGVWKTVNAVPAYPGFGQRSSVDVEYQLTTAATTPASTSTTPGALKIATADVYDYAGNNMASAFEFTKGSSSQWIRLDAAPTLPANAAVAVNTSSGQTATEGLTGYSDTSEDTNTNGQKLELTAKWGVSNITIKLYTNYSSNQNETGETRILGWVVSPSKITNFSDFYSSSDVSSDVTWDSTNTCWKYVYSKTSSDPWHTAYSGQKYFYPVSKSGIICQTPVMVTFKTNNKPTIVNGTTTGFTYSSDAAIDSTYLASEAPYPCKTIKVATSGTTVINYNRSNATVTFTTTENPTIYRFIATGPGEDGSFGTADDVPQTSAPYTITTSSSQTYTVNLPSGLSGKKLAIQLSRGEEEDSDVYEIKGPIPIAGDNVNYLWTYDNIDPELSIGSTPTIKSGSSTGSAAASFSGDETGTKYIQAATAFIAWTLTNASDVAHYQWTRKAYNETTWPGWEDISTSYVESSGITFPAPESKTDYKFRVIDTAGNISAVTSAVRLQHDEWGPEAAGGLEYHLRNGSSNVATDGMDINYVNGGVTDTDTRVISYSKTSLLQDNSVNPYYIDRIWIKLSNVTDKRDSSCVVSESGIERSGIQNYVVTLKKYETVNGVLQTTTLTPPTAPAVDAQYWEITGLNSNANDTVYEYTLKVIDNLGQTKTLKTFRTNADGTPPNLALSTGENKVQKATDANGANATDWVAKNVSGAEDNGTYYLNTDYGIINLTKTATDIFKYQVSINGGGWTDITPAVDTSTSPHSVKYIFQTPTSATTYSFKAIDGVGNESTPTTAITVKKDTDVVENDVTYSFKQFVSGTLSAAKASTYYYDPDAATATTRNIVYNAGEINRFEISIAGITDAISGVRGYRLTTGTGENATEGNLTSSTTCLNEISTTHNTSVTYSISVEDWAGNKRTIKTFTLTADGTVPDFALASAAVTTDADGQVYHNTTTDTWYVRGTNAIVNFTMSATDTTRFEWDNGTGTYITDTPITLTDMKYSFAAPASGKTYKFRAIDNVGNASADKTVIIVQDITAPAGSATYNLYKGDTETTSVANPANGTIGDYLVSTSGTTTTITYNPTKVNKLIFTPSITDAGSGYDALYRHVEGTDDTVITDNTIALTSTMNAETYVLIAKDKAGNTLDLGTYVFTAGKAPEFTGTYRTTNDGVFKIKGYTAKDDSGIAITAIPKARDNQVGENYTSNYFTTGTKIMFPKAAISSPVKYQFALSSVQENDTDKKYDAAYSNDNWSDMVVEGDGDNANYVFTLPNIDTPHRHLALFFMDILGNISPANYIGSIDSFWDQWWITAPELTTSNVTISKVCVYNNSTVSTNGGETTELDWKGVTKDYLVYIKLPKGAVIHSVVLSPAADSNSSSDTGFVWALGASGNYTHQINFTNYANPPKTGEGNSATQWKGADMGTDGWINLTESTEVGMKLKVYVWTKKTASTNMEQSDPKIIINGTIELPVFPEGGYHNIATSGALDFLPGGSLNLGDEEETPKSRAAQFFNSVADVFARNRAIEVGEQSGVEKPAASEKKAKKAAKKSKKTANKVVSTGSTTAGKGSTTAVTGSTTAVTGSSTVTGATAEKQAMAVEAAEILAQNEKSTLPEIEVATESIVNEIAGVTEKVNAAEQVVSIRPEDYSTTGATEEEGSASSKSAIIVIMLAILSSLSGAWYYKKSRKK